MLSFATTGQQILFEMGTVPKIASDKPDEAYFVVREEGWSRKVGCCGYFRTQLSKDRP